MDAGMTVWRLVDLGGGVNGGVSGGAGNCPRCISSPVCWFVKLIDLRICSADSLRDFFLRTVSFESMDEGEVT